ncbi:TnsA endonuclease N-terminal domain-containing protein [Microvirga sp. 0TCS3.31]
MARKRYALTETRIANFMGQGRGQGEGRDYKPWLKVSDVPSQGRCHRPFCLKTGREHHLLSDNEYYAFLIQWWADDVVDIREQYPLLDRRETMEIAALHGVRHPVDPSSQAVLVITTDLLTTNNTPDGTRLVAFAVKQVEDLSNRRTLEKLEIERHFWARRNVPWSILISTHLKTNYTRNLAWILGSGMPLESDERSRQSDELITSHLLEAIYRSGQQPVRTICLSVDAKLELSPGRTLKCLRHLLAVKYLNAPLESPRVQDLPGTAFTL